MTFLIIIESLSPLNYTQRNQQNPLKIFNFVFVKFRIHQKLSGPCFQLKYFFDQSFVRDGSNGGDDEEPVTP